MAAAASDGIVPTAASATASALGIEHRLEPGTVRQLGEDAVRNEEGIEHDVCQTLSRPT
jgi:hypothetical protein